MPLSSQQSSICCLFHSCLVPGESFAWNGSPLCQKVTLQDGEGPGKCKVACDRLWGLPWVTPVLQWDWLGKKEQNKKCTILWVSTDLLFESCSSTAGCWGSVTLVWYQCHEKSSLSVLSLRVWRLHAMAAFMTTIQMCVWGDRWNGNVCFSARTERINVKTAGNSQFLCHKS